MTRWSLAILLVLSWLAAASPRAVAETYKCVCPHGCGNGGIGANPGKVMTGVPKNKLRDWFGLDGPGESRQTGWRCEIERAPTPKPPAPRPAPKPTPKGPTTSRAQGDKCGAEGGYCRFTGYGRVYYGAGSRWVTQEHRNGVGCNNSVFGDPAPGTAKECRVKILGVPSALPTPKPAPKPTPRPAPAPSKPDPPSRPGRSWSGDLSGTWHDSSGHEIRITDLGGKVVARMVSRSGKRFWTRGDGRFRGDLLDMGHRRDGTPTVIVTGRPVSNDRIEWRNGTTWTRKRAQPPPSPSAPPPPRAASAPPLPSTPPPLPTGPAAASDSTTLSCSSRKKTRAACAAPGRILSASVLDRHSKAGCDEGRDWGFEGSELWVDNGCRADFLVQYESASDAAANTAPPSGGRQPTEAEALLGALLDQAGVGGLAGGSSGSSNSAPPPPAGAPRPAAPPPPIRVDLAGEWVDSYSSRLFVEQSGESIRARMLSAPGQRWWTHAEGRIDGSAIVIAQSKDSRVVEKLSGRLVGDHRIDWNDGTSWQRVTTSTPAPPPPTTAPAALAGDWHDSFGQDIRIVQDGSRFSATMLGAAGQRWWTTAAGLIDGDRVTLEQFRGSTSVERQSGRLAGPDRIEWSNGAAWNRGRASLGEGR